MPEGPEVRRYADALHELLAGRRLATIHARTKGAKAWLAEHPHAFTGHRVEWVRSRGKNLVGLVEGGLYFYAHLMMWGRWETYADAPPPEAWDRRERARVIVEGGHPAAVLLSAPVFEVGETVGDDSPFDTHSYLQTLGPDILPYPGEGAFAAGCFVDRLCAPKNREREIGAALLDQTIASGIGNYLRAEILFAGGICPFRLIRDLRDHEINALCRLIPEVAQRAYQTGGVSVPPATHERLRGDRARYVYPNGSDEWGTRHWVFRRTNLACVVCGAVIKQKRQVTLLGDEGEDDKERVIYFCPVCQRW